MRGWISDDKGPSGIARRFSPEISQKNPQNQRNGHASRCSARNGSHLPNVTLYQAKLRPDLIAEGPESSHCWESGSQAEKEGLVLKDEYA